MPAQKLQRTSYGHLAWAQAYTVHVSSQIQATQEQGNDCGGGGDGGGSVYSKYRSNARNYHNGLYPSLSKFSCNKLCTPYICDLREKPEQVCNALGIEQDSLQASEDSTADPHEIENMHTREEKRFVNEVPCKDCKKTYIGETKRH